MEKEPGLSGHGCSPREGTAGAWSPVLWALLSCAAADPALMRLGQDPRQGACRGRSWEQRLAVWWGRASPGQRGTNYRPGLQERRLQVRAAPCDGRDLLSDDTDEGPRQPTPRGCGNSVVLEPGLLL